MAFVPICQLQGKLELVRLVELTLFFKLDIIRFPLSRRSLTMWLVLQKIIIRRYVMVSNSNYGSGTMPLPSATLGSVVEVGFIPVRGAKYRNHLIKE